jgi:hypothetical protein
MLRYQYAPHACATSSEDRLVFCVLLAYSAQFMLTVVLMAEFGKAKIHNWPLRLAWVVAFLCGVLQLQTEVTQAEAVTRFSLLRFFFNASLTRC